MRENYSVATLDGIENKHKKVENETGRNLRMKNIIIGINHHSIKLPLKIRINIGFFPEVVQVFIPDLSIVIIILFLFSSL